jgi:hypothetical protein
VAALELYADGRGVPRVTLGDTALPELDVHEGDISVERAPIGAAR